MKRLIQFALYGVAVLASIVFVGCTDDVALDPPAVGGESVVFNFVVDDLDVAIGDQGATKAITDQPSTEPSTDIKNMWIVQFDSAGLLLDKQYFDTFSTTDCVNLVDEVDDIVFIANTFSAELITDEIENLDDLKAIKIDNLFGTDGTTKYFILNGTIENYNPKQGATVKLKRNVARVNIKVSENISSSYTLQDIKVYNVPADSPIYTNYTNAEIAATTFAEDIDITTELQAADGATLYLPVNQQGEDDTIKDSKDKPTSSKVKNATYVKVKFKTSKNKVYRTYTFYLGEDMTKDFNITANNAYYYTFSITSKGDVDSDARVEEEIVVTYIPMACAKDIANWKTENAGNQKAIAGLTTEFINFEYSDYEVQGTNWRCDDRSLEWFADYANHNTDLNNEYGIDSVNEDVDDDVLPALREVCGDDVNIPSQEQLMYMWIFKGDNSFQSRFYWSSMVISNYSDISSSRWYVGFDNGLTCFNSASYYRYARAVRKIVLS